MSRIKVGDKDYEVKVTNRVIVAIEDDFGGKSIEEIISDSKMSMGTLGKLVWHVIKDNIEYENFMDDFLPNQYKDAGFEVGKAIQKSFTTGSKKK